MKWLKVEGISAVRGNIFPTPSLSESLITKHLQAVWDEAKDKILYAVSVLSHAVFLLHQPRKRKNKQKSTVWSKP